jgi:hypothetical protein
VIVQWLFIGKSVTIKDRISSYSAGVFTLGRVKTNEEGRGVAYKE